MKNEQIFATFIYGILIQNLTGFFMNKSTFFEFVPTEKEI